MKLTREIAQKQAARLQSSPMLCPQSKDGKTEVVDCLLRHCQDAEHAERTMTAVLDNALKVQNLTAEIAEAAHTGRNPELAPPGCNVCRRVEPISGTVDYASHVPSTRNGIDCAVRCDCERGRWLSARDAQRAVEEPVKPARVAGGGRVARVSRIDTAKLAAGDSE